MSYALEVLGIAPTDGTLVFLLILQALMLVIVWMLYRQQLRLTQLLQVEARTDSLTQIPNRRYFFEMLESNLALAGRHHQPLSLFIIDLDNFKQINDHYGHAAGDKVLRKVTALLAHDIRGGDCIGRIGGEEFCVQLPLTSIHAAHVLAERIRQRVESIPFPDISPDLRVTCSIGLAAFQPGISADALVELADNALYEAKAAGKNCVRDVTGAVPANG